MTDIRAFAFLSEQVCALTGVDPQRVKPTSRLIDFGIDSARALEVVAAAEDAYELEIPDRVLLDLHTLEDLAGWIEAQKAS